MQDHFTPQQLQNPDIPKEPDYEKWPRGGEGILLATVPTTQMLEVTPVLPAVGVQVLDPAFSPVAAATAGPVVWRFSVTPGRYLVQFLLPGGGVLAQQTQDIRATGEVYRV